MDRRSFLISINALIASQLLAGCGGNNKPTLKIKLLKDSLPGRLVNEFRHLQKNTQVDVALVEQLNDMFKQLEVWQSKPQPSERSWFEQVRSSLPFGQSSQKPSADLLTLGDFWLKGAIEKKLIQPLDVGKVQRWSDLPKQWQELVTRNDQGIVDLQGKVWAVPYRWGNTVIIYNRDKFKEKKWAPPEDWADLWRDELRDSISLLDHPREVIGLVLKKLQKSYNTQDLNTVSQLEEELKKLHQQVKFYGSTKYIEPLLLGDTVVAVGWSQDILPMIVRYPFLSAVVPKSGTAMWSDVWVNPTGRQSEQEPLNKWINFFLEKNVAEQVAILTKTNSPIPVSIPESKIQEPLRNLLLINQDIIAKSEFLLPFSQQSEAQYQNLFTKIKNL